AHADLLTLALGVLDDREVLAHERLARRRVQAQPGELLERLAAQRSRLDLDDGEVELPGDDRRRREAKAEVGRGDLQPVDVALVAELGDALAHAPIISRELD